LQRDGWLVDSERRFQACVVTNFTPQFLSFHRTDVTGIAKNQRLDEKDRKTEKFFFRNLFIAISRVGDNQTF
jgi:hypothetical protein